jgi:hypothetical protein
MNQYLVFRGSGGFVASGGKPLRTCFRGRLAESS